MKIFVVVYYGLAEPKDLATFKDFYDARDFAWSHPLLCLRVEERIV